jgi:hypothetical protein
MLRLYPLSIGVVHERGLVLQPAATWWLAAAVWNASYVPTCPSATRNNCLVQETNEIYGFMADRQFPEPIPLARQPNHC